jgi:hypothetical protein
MIPRRVTAPTDQIVSLSDMKAHLRVMHDDEDLLISSLIDAATAHMDGWRGVLGRCIMSQQWAVDCPGAGCWRMPFPDVLSVAASAGTATLTHDSLGSIVSLSEAATVTMTVQMPLDALPAVQAVVKLLVAHWFEQREAVTAAATMVTVPMAVDALLAPIRWVKI